MTFQQKHQVLEGNSLIFKISGNNICHMKFYIGLNHSWSHWRKVIRKNNKIKTQIGRQKQFERLRIHTTTMILLFVLIPVTQDVAKSLPGCFKLRVLCVLPRVRLWNSSWRCLDFSLPSSLFLSVIHAAALTHSVFLSPIALPCVVWVLSWCSPGIVGIRNHALLL